ncbi:MAG: MGMT family protein [Spirochaetaceae bacterium]|nr:MAG: MGMT family protein [Spirochaetaceae bacterium]
MVEKDVSFSERVKRLIKEIPNGKVATYGQIAACAGNHRASRQVAWLLNSSSRKHRLPWHRVINSRGGISLPIGGGFEEQKMLLEAEGIVVDENGRVKLSRYLWNPSHDSQM